MKILSLIILLVVKEMRLQPLVSVIIPVFNVEMYLTRCLESILRQTYRNLEIIIVDDGSTDLSSKICDDYKTHDQRIIVFHQDNSGQSGARNKALDSISGDYLCFVDSDDYISPLYVERLVDNILKYQSDISVCDYYLVSSSGDEYKKESGINEGICDSATFMRQESTTDYMWCIALWNKLFRSVMWNDIRFKMNKYAEDSFAFTEYMDKANSISILKEPLYYYCQRNNSEVNSFSIKNLDSVEARFERIDRYTKKEAKRILGQTVEILSKAFQNVDFRDINNRVRYNEIREQYRYRYLLAYDHIDLSKCGIKNALYYFSDELYYHVFRILRCFREIFYHL